MNRIEEARNKVVLTEHEVLNTASTDFPGQYAGYDDSWDFDKFKKQFRIQVLRLKDIEMEFDMIGVDPAIANAIRRLLISEVPTMAIEKVFIYNNTSLIQDEVLAHRLGLIPLKADPRLFEYRQEGDTEGTPEDTLEFHLKVRCSKNTQAGPDATRPEEMYRDHQALSGHIKWVPLGDQAQTLDADRVGVVHDDILIAKLRPGHELDIKLHAVKGIGKDHAKFSPVATAYYRLLPEITLLQEIEGERAERLQKCFLPGVIELEEKNGGKKVAKVKDARYDMCSGNVFRYDDLKDAVKISRLRHHFIFNVESTGALTPDILVVEAVQVLKKKCRAFLAELEDK